MIPQNEEFVVSDAFRAEVLNAIFSKDPRYGAPSKTDSVYRPKVVHEIEDSHVKAFMLSTTRAPNHHFVLCFVHGDEETASDHVMDSVEEFYGGKFNVHGEFIEGKAKRGKTSFSIFGFFTVKEEDVNHSRVSFLPN